MLYLIVINSVFFFCFGYTIKALIGMKFKKLNGELPIVLQFQLNGKGGYDVGVFNMSGSHLIPYNHKNFRDLLIFLSMEEGKRILSKPNTKLKLLKFKKDD